MDSIIEHAKFQVGIGLTKAYTKGKNMGLKYAKLSEADWAGKTAKKNVIVVLINLIHLVDQLMLH